MVIREAKAKIAREVVENVKYYVAAIGRREGVAMIVRKERGIEEEEEEELLGNAEEVDIEFEAVVEKRLMECQSLPAL
jgi:hypothetical protein